MEVPAALCHHIGRLTIDWSLDRKAPRVDWSAHPLSGGCAPQAERLAGQVEVAVDSHAENRSVAGRELQY